MGKLLISASISERFSRTEKVVNGSEVFVVRACTLHSSTRMSSREDGDYFVNNDASGMIASWRGWYITLGSLFPDETLNTHWLWIWARNVRKTERGNIIRIEKANPY